MKREAPMARTIAATIGRATSLTRRLTPIKTVRCEKGSGLAEALAFRLEQVVLRQAAREAQESAVGDHAVGRAHAAAAHCPTSLEQLVDLEHAEAANLAQAVEKPLDLAHVGAEGENDAPGPERQLGAGHRLPWLGEVEQDPVKVALIEPGVGVPKLEGQVAGQVAERVDDRLPGRLLDLLSLLVAHDVSLGPDGTNHGERERAGSSTRLEH